MKNHETTCPQCKQYAWRSEEQGRTKLNCPSCGLQTYIQIAKRISDETLELIGIKPIKL